jgi:hypothetical protein
MSDNSYSCPMSMKNQLPPLSRLRSLRALLARLENQSGQAYGGPVGMRHQRPEELSFIKRETPEPFFVAGGPLFD